MRILVCTPHLSYPPIDGASLRIFKIFEFLSKSHDIYLFFLKNSIKDLQAAEIYYNRGIFKDFFHLKPPEFPEKIISFLTRSFLNREVPRFKRIVKQEIKRIVKEKDIDIMHVHLLPMGLLLADFNSIPKVLDLTDSMTLYWLRELRLLRNPFSFFLNCFYFMKAARNERYLLGKFDITTVVSPVDKECLRKLNKAASVRVIRNGVDIHYFSSKCVEEDYPSILFSGNMSYPPNVDAALYIAREILPLIRSEIPETKFYIVGAHPPDVIKKLSKNEGVVVTGFVDDVSEYISKASVVLALVRRGCGIKNKILEAMALGKPVVTNPMGAESLCQNAKCCLAIGKNSHEIAKKTVELLKNKALREDLGRKTAEVMKKRYAWEFCSKEYEKIFQQISRKQ
jgi:glycosyltransferase involved in cell wall biosynthesis